MISPDAPISGCCNANAFYFWHLRINKAFERPRYYIGETVLHRIKVPNGEILHPVMVIGLWWTGAAWAYFIQMPKDHPQFDADEGQVDEVEEWQLEAI